MREFAEPPDPPAAGGGAAGGDAEGDAGGDDAGCDPPHAAAMTAEPKTAKRIRAR
jgi:hypothetical protein